MQEIDQFIHHPYPDPPDRYALKPGIYIKQTLQDKSAFLKRRVIRKRLSQISCSDYDKVMGFVQSEDLADLRVQMLYIISVSLLSESSEIVQILPDLRCRHMHLLAQVAGRDPLYACIEQFPQKPVIPRQPGYNCTGYFSVFQFYHHPYNTPFYYIE